MKSENKIEGKVFVVVNPTRREHPALDRAIMNASLPKFPSQISLVVYIAADPDVDDMSAANAAIYCNGDWFKELFSRINTAKIKSEVIVSWSNEWRKGILDRARATGARMLMIPLYPDSETKRSIFTEDKWFLLRNSEVPILMVRPGKPGKRHCVLAAVKEQDDSYRNLNRKIMERGKWASELYGAELHIVNSHRGSMDFPNRTKMLRADVPNENIHIRQGDPIDVIAEVANEIGADIVLIGTKHRSGLKAVMKGHTIERLIRKIPQDLMIQVE